MIEVTLRLSRLFEVIGTNTDRSVTCDFLLVIHRSHGSISYRSKINGENWKFLSPRVFNAPLRVFPLEYCNGGGAQKTRMMPTPY